MNAVGRIGSYIYRGVGTVSGPFHPFGGAIDIIVIEQPDGTFKSSPWYVRFGKFQGVLKNKRNAIQIDVNGVEAGFTMYLAHTGQAYFLREVEDIIGDGEALIYPLSSGDESDAKRSNVDDVRRTMKSKSCNYDAGSPRNDSGGKHVSKPGILGFMFGGRSVREDEDHEEDSYVKRATSMERAEMAADLLEVKWSTNLDTCLTINAKVPKPPKSNSSMNDEDRQDGVTVNDNNDDDDVDDDDEVVKTDELSEASGSTSLLVDGSSFDAICSALSVPSEGNRKLDVCVESTTAEELRQDIVTLCSMEFERDLSNTDVQQDTENVENSHEESSSSLQYENINNSEEFEFDDLEKPKGEKVIYKENEKLEIVSNPINIRRNNYSGEDDLRVKSLPDLRNHVPDFDENCCRPLSRSLGSKPMEKRSRKFESSSENAANEEGNVKDDDSSDIEAFKHVLDNPEVVELSLCKHLLHERMGAEEASKVFDLEKLDTKKVASLGSSIIKNDKLAVRIGGCYFPWEAAAPILLKIVSFGADKISEPKGMIPVDQIEKPDNDAHSGNGNWKIWPFSLKNSSNDGKILEPSTQVQEKVEIENLSKPKMVKKTVRALTPTSEQLATLNLKEGRNSVTFTFSTNVLGTQKVDARIFLWKWSSRIVISDVDGTITRSDVLGQFMPLVGIDWSQTGVTHLFSGIKENGYHLIFLSARAISQASVTRQFLVNLKQDGKTLPDGPVVISPDGLFPSLFREVIRRAPHEFKIACLEEIRALFPSDHNPFYAGFGNRDTDEISYLKVGIPRGKIFIINPKGEVAVNRRIDTRSYTSLRDLVNGMFPATASSEWEDFNTWNFWKLPPPLFDV